MIGDWVLYDFEQFFLRVCGANGEFVQKLNHEPSKTFEGARYANSRADFDEDSASGMDVYLQLPSLVDR